MNASKFIQYKVGIQRMSDSFTGGCNGFFYILLI